MVGDGPQQVQDHFGERGSVAAGSLPALSGRIRMPAVRIANPPQAASLPPQEAFSPEQWASGSVVRFPDTSRLFVPYREEAQLITCFA